MRQDHALVAGGAAAAWAVLEMASIAVHPTPDMGAGSDTVESFLASGDAARYEIATVLHVLALGLLVVAASRAWVGLRHRGAPAVAQLAAMTALGVCAAAYLTGRVLVDGVLRNGEGGSAAGTALPLLEAGTASLWLGTTALGGFGLATAVGIRLTQGSTGWLSAIGAVIGLALVPALPLARSGYVHVASLALMLWIVVAVYQCAKSGGTPAADLESEVVRR